MRGFEKGLQSYLTRSSSLHQNKARNFTLQHHHLMGLWTKVPIIVCLTLKVYSKFTEVKVPFVGVSVPSS